MLPTTDIPCLWVWSLSILLLCLPIGVHSKTEPAPISVAPSQLFEGNDGPWSTFPIRIGTPEQTFHVLISTAGQETWVPVPEGCLTTDPANCGALRGALPFQNKISDGFLVNASSTWEPVNLFGLGLEDTLNYTGNGEYGYDTVGLALANSGGPTLVHQVVAGIATKDFYLGVFGLGPKPTNFTGFTDNHPSYLWTLKNQSLIPSLSWGYTAGAPYRLKQVPGSLTLGGYDASKFTPNNVTFTMSEDDSRSLTVSLQAITASNTLSGLVSFLSTNILTFIDSTVPEIWLPIEACEVFESAFGLTYDAHTDRYLVNSTVHSKLTAINPVLTLSLANNDTVDAKSIQIQLPYKAFDLVAQYPIYPNATSYFPLRRAANASQYTLGRVFLQESYIIADYERQTFSVSQCIFSDTSSSHLIAIDSPTSKSSSLSKKILIPIIVIAVLLVIISATSLYILIQWRKKKRAKQEAAVGDGHEDYTVVIPVEISPHEKHLSSEIDGTSVGMRHEMESPKIDQEIFRHEMHSPTMMSELPAEPVSRNVRNTI